MATKDGDPYVLNVQQWVNNTYRGKTGYTEIPENGKTGWTTIYALLHALQIELGITATADNFGTGTVNAFNRDYPNGVKQQDDGDTTKKNIYGIIQGALLCKGYSIGASTPTCNFYGGTGLAIIKLKNDAGLTDATSTVTLNVMKALMSMDYFYSYDTSERTQNIIEMQRYLNRNYEDYTGLCPCDGIYARRTSKALIYAIQAEEKMPTSVANGNCGPATKNALPSIMSNGQYSGTSYLGRTYSSSDINKFKILANIALYFNGFGNGNISANLDMNVIKSFQSKYAISVNGNIDYTTWLSLLVSCGDQNRSAKACDCATILTAAKAQTLYENGYRYVGRYLANVPGGRDKELSVNELNIAFNAGLRIFPIQQGTSNTVDFFTEANAVNEVKIAYEHAINLGIPEGTIIYFAVDCDPQDTDITNKIIPYFSKVFSTMVNTYNSKYKIGVYGTRNVCSRVSEKGYAISSFVSDMSTGFSGNLGFSIPDNWAFDQFATVSVGTGSGQIEIDKDGFSGRDSGFGSASLSSVNKVYNNLKTLYGYVKSYKNANKRDANLRTLEYLRYLSGKYGSAYSNTDMWAIVAGPMDAELCSTIDAVTNFKESDFIFNDPKTNVSYDTLHFAATLNAMLYEVVDNDFAGLDSFVDHYAGWAGDVITFAETIKENGLSQDAANKLICTTSSSKFQIDDYLADVDAVVCAKMLENEEMELPELFFKYFMSNNPNTGNSYLLKRTTEFLNIMGTYNTFLTTCNTVVNSDEFPYSTLRGMLISPESSYTEELAMSSIAFLQFVANEYNKEN